VTIRLRPEQSARTLPGKAKYGGYLYAVRFKGGLVKVGWTTHPASRVRSHEDHAAVFGVSRREAWVSPLHDNPKVTEKTLIALASRLSSGLRRHEYFTGINFSAFVAEAGRIPFAPVDYAAHEEALKRARAKAAALFPRRADSSEREDPTGTQIARLTAAMGELFGRVDVNGERYAWPGSGVRPTRSTDRAYFDQLVQIAEIKGVAIEAVLDSNPLEMYTQNLLLMAENEARLVMLWAQINKRADLLTPFGDGFRRCNICGDFALLWNADGSYDGTICVTCDADAVVAAATAQMDSASLPSQGVNP
jgi:hypothetical protein